MIQTSNKNLWQFRRVKNISNSQRFVLTVLVTAGIFSIIQFGEWWFRPNHVNNIFLFVLLSGAFWYGLLRIIIIWINYLKISVPESVKADRDLSVAIFTTSSPGEPLEMFEKTLAACKNIAYPHTTYLLDDTSDDRFKQCAERHGAVWLELVGLPGAKAGKINEALLRTKEEFILVLDPDHIPFPNFLDHTLGYFKDPEIGFVQVSQAYYNQYKSFTAKGAAEQTYTFYGPMQIAMNGSGCSVAIGANCTFRRKALESIKGHGVGLSEDLITSIRLHAAGWKSVYNPVIVSRGLVPEDLGSFCKQQLKWSRGLFEVAFAEIPRNFNGLTGWQKLSYLTISTYYLTGVTSLLFTIIPFLFFFTGLLPAKMSFTEFLIHGSFVAIFAVAIYLYVQKWLCHPEVERGIHWRGMVLKYSSWSVFFLGFVLSVINAEIPYIPTAKKAVRDYFTPYARPLLIQIIVFVITFVSVVIYRRFYMPESELLFSAEKTWAMMGFALIAFILSVAGVLAALEAKVLKEEDPWDKVNLNDIIIMDDAKKKV